MSKPNLPNFEELYREHASPLLAFLASRVRPRTDRDEVAQEVWTRVWANLATFHGGEFRPWLFQIARNLLVDRLRRRRADPLPDELDPIDRRARRPDSALDAREELQRLEHCLALLPEQERELFNGRLSGANYEELIEQLGLTVKEAYRMFHRAKNRLQECVQRGAQ
jgi:RNA polymerase sigma-70 factor (ECF subfamily)